MKTILILAHPGHELRVFHWLETVRPTVCILTDGSGGSQASRIAYSEDSVVGAGASVGPVFGVMSDKDWYGAILAGNGRPFHEAVEKIVNAARGEPEVTVVADAVDGYNPVHDLAAAVGSAVAIGLAKSGSKVTMLVSAAVPGVAGEIAREILLDDDAQKRKAAAIRAYYPLAEEARRILEEDPASFGRETLLQANFDWPSDFEPQWEKFGRKRVATGRYADLITYREHVLPLAKAIRGR